MAENEESLRGEEEKKVAELNIIVFVCFRIDNVRHCPDRPTIKYDKNFKI